ncbi:MAG: hypothetical protein ACOC4C_01805 [Fibrobacterota bacterium]
MIPKTMARILPSWLWSRESDSEVVISTRVRLARNLLNHQFPSRASLLERKRIFEEIRAQVMGLSACRGFECCNFASADGLDKQFLAENRAVSYDMLNLDGDRGVVFDKSFQSSVMINEEDHIRMQFIGSGCCAERLWEELDQLDTMVGNKLRFAFDSRKGFLTSCPTNSGTGLRVSFLLHLPGLVLTKTIDQTLQGVTQMGLAARGFFGENSQVAGNFFQLSNQATMGSGEEEFIESTRRIIQGVIECENAARDRILNEAEVEIEDKIFRSYGILQYARTLGVDELLNLASALRFGVESGIFNKTDKSCLNRMILMTMPAHIQLLDGKKQDKDKLNLRRAEMVQALLNGEGQ